MLITHISIFEMHTIERVPLNAIGDVQFANKHFSLLAGYISRSALRMVCASSVE